MARTLAQIISELNPTFQAQTNSLQSQQQLIPGEIQSQEQALNAQKDSAYGDIVAGAQRRGLGFSGIPLGEQAKYAATTYAPALAQLRQQGQQKAMSLQDAILGINERRDTLGQNIYQQEQDRSFQASEAEKNRRAQAAASAAASPTFGSFGSGTTAPTQKASIPSIQQRADKGFNFQDSTGRSISAAAYSKLTGVPFRTLLQQMANKGDQGAKSALGFVGNDYGYNPTKVGSNQQTISLLNNLLWGVGNVKPYTQPARQTAYDNKLKAASGGRAVSTQSWL